MSIDIKIQNKCDDVINWERRNLNSDRRTIDLSYPVASASSVSLRINNVIISPTAYLIYTDRNSLTLIPQAHIKLKEICRLYSPLVEIKYVTIGTYCPKCAGFKYVDDYKYGPDKDVVTVSDELLLIQTFEKHIVTHLNSNVYHKWVGTRLNELVKSKITDISFITSRIKDDIVKASNDLKKVQAQYQRSNRPVTKGELFGQLLDVGVRRDEQEPTTIHALVKFTAQSGKTLEYEQLLEFSQLRRR